MTVFERIKKLSKDRGWSLQTVASKAGLGTNSIYKWKSQTPKLDKLDKVANVLNVSVDYLLGKSDIEKPKSVELTDNDVIMTFEGKPIQEEDRELIKRLLRGK